MSAWDGTLLELLSSKKVIFIKMCPSNENCGGEITNYIKEQNHILEGFVHLRSAAKQLSLNYETGAQENIYLACNIFLYRKL